MVEYKTTILKFNNQGEKTGWSYIHIPADVANEIFPANKKSFRVKGTLDLFSISGVSLLPMGKGDFIIPFNAAMRKGTGKRHGAQIFLKIEKDDSVYQLANDLVECLSDDPAAESYFYSLPKSHQNYYSKWIESAKSDDTKAKRLALTVEACARRMSYSEMMRESKRNNDNR